MRPLPSIRTESMPRRASCAAIMVPEKPPPMIATGTARSDFIVGPVLRIGCARLAALDMVIDPGDRLARRVGEPAWNCRVNERRATGAEQLRTDFDCARAMAGPRHSEGARMFQEKPMDDPLLAAIDVGLVGCH